MPARTAGPAERIPRRLRPAPAGDDPTRGNLAAAAGVCVLLVHLLFAQCTLALAVVFTATSQLSRWRPLWLAAPAATGLIWACAIGPGRALAGFTAGPGQVAGYLAAALGHPAALLRFSRGYAGLAGWLPGQLPLALIAAAGEAAVAGWLRRRRTGEPDIYRPGLIAALRRRGAAAALAAGHTVTADGAFVGVDPATGRRAVISWPEARRGVLVTGVDEMSLAQTGMALAVAAIRRRQAVLVIDLAGRAEIDAGLTAACAAAGAPLRRFGAAGPGCYEPLRGRPEHIASLALAMIDWSGVSDARRRAAAAYLTDACAVAAAAPSSPPPPVLDDLAGLLAPEALRARAARIPRYQARRQILLDRAGTSATLLARDPAAIAAAAQLARLRGSALGQWLRPAPAAPDAGPVRGPVPPCRIGPAGQPPAPAGPAVPISFGQALRDRAVVSFALDRAVHGRAAAMIAALAVADLLEILAELAAMAVRTDCLIWISGCESLAVSRLAELVRRGQRAGAAAVLTTSSAPAAEQLAGATGVIAVRGRAEPAIAAVLADLAAPATAAAKTGTAGPGPGGADPFWPGDGELATAGLLSGCGTGALTLLVRGPRGRLLRSCLAGPAARGGGR